MPEPRPRREEGQRPDCRTTHKHRQEHVPRVDRQPREHDQRHEERVHLDAERDPPDHRACDRPAPTPPPRREVEEAQANEGRGHDRRVQREEVAVREGAREGDQRPDRRHALQPPPHRAHEQVEHRAGSRHQQVRAEAQRRERRQPPRRQRRRHRAPELDEARLLLAARVPEAPDARVAEGLARVERHQPQPRPRLLRAGHVHRLVVAEAVAVRGGGEHDRHEREHRRSLQRAPQTRAHPRRLPARTLPMTAASAPSASSDPKLPMRKLAGR